MTLDLIYVLVLRILHITGGVLWVGTSMFLVIILEPTMRAAAAEGNRFASKLGSSNMSKVIASAAGTTILAGILLYIHNVTVIGSEWAKAGPGLVFGIGAAFGIVGMVVGMMVGSITRKMGALGKEIEAAGGPPSPEKLQQMAALSERMSRVSHYGLALVLIALICMEVARYIPS